MGRRASLTLMELLVIVLVFALCAALCLRVFVAADGISQENHLRDEATLLAQNTAEALKAGISLPEVPEGLSRAVTSVPSVPQTSPSRRTSSSPVVRLFPAAATSLQAVRSLTQPAHGPHTAT